LRVIAKDRLKAEFHLNKKGAIAKQLKKTEPKACNKSRHNFENTAIWKGSIQDVP